MPEPPGHHNAAEITSTGAHVGRGMGIHYHADGHSALSNAFTLYNIHDYPGQQRPPLIGFGFDGGAVFGIYETDFDSMDGYDTGLDTYGGHSHGTLGNHYHALMSETTSLLGNDSRCTLSCVEPGGARSTTFRSSGRNRELRPTR